MSFLIFCFLIQDQANQYPKNEERGNTNYNKNVVLGHCGHYKLSNGLLCAKLGQVVRGYTFPSHVTSRSAEVGTINNIIQSMISSCQPPVSQQIFFRELFFTTTTGLSTFWEFICSIQFLQSLFLYQYAFFYFKSPTFANIPNRTIFMILKTHQRKFCQFFNDSYLSLEFLDGLLHMNKFVPKLFGYQSNRHTGT